MLSRNSVATIATLCRADSLRLNSGASVWNLLRGGADLSLSLAGDIGVWNLANACLVSCTDGTKLCKRLFDDAVIK
jgi:hypothetical protein